MENSSIPTDNKESFERRIKKITHSYKWGRNRFKMRAQQGAFNCIEISEDASLDPIVSKIQALANFHDLKVERASPTFDILKELKSKFTKNIGELSEGIYFLRVIKPEDNEKLEARGHSMVLLRTSGGDYFFDPNKGLEKIEENTEDRLFEHLKHDLKRFGISQATFLKVHEDR